MFFKRRLSHSYTLDIWPGFVDALAALLMVIIFVLMTFVVSQLSLTDALQGRDQALAHVNQQLHHIKEALGLEQKQHALTKKTKESLEETLSELRLQIQTLKTSLGEIEVQKNQSINENETLIQKIEQLNRSLGQLQQNLTDKENEAQDLQKRFDQTLAQKIAELEHLNNDLKILQSQHESLTVEHQKNDRNKRLGHFRSEFFANLQQAIGDRSDIRVVGDRFVFQSEVLFDKASAELGAYGRKKLDQLIKALKEISQKIPKDFNWVLRVDGHTDHWPIKTPQFPSNWELSSARAISVVKYMTDKGIDPHHLVAAGFGEHQPLNLQTKDEKELARNRRIEFKLDQR